MDVVTVIAGLVSAFAALGALWFARDTVRETRALRREDRLARLPELVAELGETGLRIRVDRGQQPVFRIRRADLARPLRRHRRNCRPATRSPGFYAQIDWPLELLLNAVEAALIEVAERLGEASDVEGALK
jgi:hypothetical protein